MGRSYWITWILISAVATFFMLPVGLIVMVISLVVIPGIYQRIDRKEYAEWIASEAQQEIDELETELDAMTSKNEKVTPIWEIPLKKK